MKCIVHQDQVPAKDMPGRALKWLFTPDTGIAQHFSMNVVSIKPGQRVRPAHEHPGIEEVIYITSGTGRVLIDRQVYDIRAGSAVLFQPGAVHMVENSSDVDMEIVCVFSPPATLEDYVFHSDIDFP